MNKFVKYVIETISIIISLVAAVAIIVVFAGYIPEFTGKRVVAAILVITTIVGVYSVVIYLFKKLLNKRGNHEKL